MENLIKAVKATRFQSGNLPFAVYCSSKTQHLHNVPLVNPMLIVVLEGEKHIGNQGLTCKSGDFIFLSNSSSIEIRNIPKENSYLALLIEFSQEDFVNFPINKPDTDTYLIGKTSVPIEKNLLQFIEWSRISPPELWHLRKRELLALLCHLGYEKILAIATPRSVSSSIHRILSSQNKIDISLDAICHQLALSESTLRRRLSEENTSLQAIKDQIKFGKALHLIQTSHHSIAQIALDCGYESASRFSHRFKTRFGITPSELRKSI